MILRDLIDIGYRLETPSIDLHTFYHGVYVGDYLSIVMKSAQSGNLLVTSQATMNAVAVAVLLDLPAILFVETVSVPEPIVKKAESEGVAILSTDKTAFSAMKRLWENRLA